MLVPLARGADRLKLEKSNHPAFFLAGNLIYGCKAYTTGGGTVRPPLLLMEPELRWGRLRILGSSTGFARKNGNFCKRIWALFTFPAYARDASSCCCCSCLVTFEGRTLILRCWRRAFRRFGVAAAELHSGWGWRAAEGGRGTEERWRANTCFSTYKEKKILLLFTNLFHPYVTRSPWYSTTVCRMTTTKGRRKQKIIHTSIIFM